MRKQLEIINRIESQKVELGMNVELADFKADFERYLKKADELNMSVFKNENTMNQLRKTYNAEMVKIFKDSKEMVSTYKMMVSTVTKQLEIIKKQSQELGLSPDQVPAYKLGLQILESEKFKYLSIYDKKQQADF